MKIMMNKFIKLCKEHKFILVILILLLISFSVAVYSNRIGIKYYLNKFLGLNSQVSDESKDIKEDIKPLTISFTNWYIEVDLDDMNNLYKNVNLDNVIINGGVGEYNIQYEIKKDGYTSRMFYTVTDEANNTATQSQRITYVLSRTNRNKAYQEFYNIARKYNYSVASMNEDYKSGRFNKYVNGKYYRIIDINNQRIEVSTVGSQGTPTNNYCDYDVIRDYYNCILDNTNIKYENYSELKEPTKDLINEYNKMLEEYIQSGYIFEFLIAQVKD